MSCEKADGDLIKPEVRKDVLEEDVSGFGGAGTRKGWVGRVLCAQHLGGERTEADCGHQGQWTLLMAGMESVSVGGQEG